MKKEIKNLIILSLFLCIVSIVVILVFGRTYNLKFDYKSVARGALLHDFYLDGNERTKIRI